MTADSQVATVTPQSETITDPLLLHDVIEHGEAGDKDSEGLRGEFGGERTAVSSANATVASSVTNIVNNIIGAGLLTLPWAFRQSSVLWGGALLVMVCWLCAYSFVLLARSSDITGSFSYKEIAMRAFSKRAGPFVQGTVLMYTCGSCISYVVLVGDFLPPVLSHFALPAWAQDRTVSIVVTAVFILLPLSLLRDLNPLRFTSFVGVLCVVYAAGLVITRFFTTFDANNHVVAEGVTYTKFKPSMFIALPLVSVSFTCHYNGLKYYSELRNRSVSTFRTAATWSLLLSLGFYVATGVSGYFTFGSRTQGDILNNYDKDTWAMLGRLFVGFNIIFTYPQAFNSLRKSIEIIFFAKARPTLTRHVAETVLFLTLTVIFGILIPKVEVVLAYKGAIFGSTIVYILPSLMYYKLANLARPGVSWLERFPPILMATFGVVTGILGVVITSLHPSRD